MDGEQRVIADRYEIRESVGTGGMADVFRATDRRLGRDVAIKMLLPAYAREPEFVERFRREARAAAAVNHPNVVAVYDWGSYGDSSFMVMEYVPGPTLKDTIRERAPLSESEALSIAEQAASGLQAAHEHGLVHRDVKPHNILQAPDGRVKVADFGIAYAAGATQLTATNAVSGTAMYMSPEQVQIHRVDARSDVYSLGIVLYEMLTGLVPYNQGSMVEIAMQHVNAALPNVRVARPDLRPETVAVLERALAKSPADRYANAGELRSALHAITEQRPVVSVPRATASPEDRPDTTVVRQMTPVVAQSIPRVRGTDQRSRGMGGWLLAVPLVFAVLAIVAVLVLHHPSQHHAGGPPSHGFGTPAPAPTSTRSAHNHAIAATPSHPATRPPAATTVPTSAATDTPSPSTPGVVALRGAPDPISTVQTFYSNILHQNFAAAAALWTANMRSSCDPAICIDQRFAATTSARVRLRLISPPQDGQATVGVDLQEVNNNISYHWVGSWNLVEQGGRWLLDHASFCRPAVDAGCTG